MSELKPEEVAKQIVENRITTEWPEIVRLADAYLSSRSPENIVIDDRDVWRRAIDMLNEIHETMGIDDVIKAKMERTPMLNLPKFSGAAVHKRTRRAKKWSKRDKFNLRSGVQAVKVEVFTRTVLERYSFVRPTMLSRDAMLNPKPLSLLSLAQWNKAAIPEITAMPTQIGEWYRVLLRIGEILNSVSIYLTNARDSVRAKHVAQELNDRSVEFEILTRPAEGAPPVPQGNPFADLFEDDDLKGLPKTPRMP